ncbi:hypothetical protein LOK49_LG08G01244 [Camellia lanceoleosa]|uniref:Uncharacterized protein n=1 Tax=Camellia lanceoleosa TaxID=1840588 RepID=A0ACC0GWY7_9ERIC|nr:hypothetical protein LOK49_LG08G01244 [Camellia lanceoleosa]
MFPDFSVESITLVYDDWHGLKDAYVEKTVNLHLDLEIFEHGTEKGSNEIALKAMGRAINKTVMIAELIECNSYNLSSTWSSNNGVVEYNGDGGWDGGRGYGGRGRVRGRGRGFRGCGRGYGGGDMQQDLGGYHDYGGLGAPFAQGRGRGRGRGHGCSWGCGRGRGRGQDFRSDGPVQAAA